MFHLKKLSRLLCCSLLFAQFDYAGGNAKAIAHPSQAVSQSARTPTETVREFYKALREKRFREAFALSAYNVAINGLSDAEFAALRTQFKKLSDQEFAALRPKFQPLTTEEYDELRPDFEKLAMSIPNDVTIGGEQISNNDAATVFVEIKDVDKKTTQAEPVTLFRDGDKWIIGDRASANLIKLEGKEFFFNLRIKTHEAEARNMLQRIKLAEIAYGAQHNGTYADIPALIAVEFLPKDIQSTESTGYSFQLTLAPDARTFKVNATPARYLHTGRLSFFMDAKGVEARDAGGKTFDPRSDKKPQ